MSTPDRAGDAPGAAAQGLSRALSSSFRTIVRSRARLAQRAEACHG